MSERHDDDSVRAALRSGDATAAREALERNPSIDPPRRGGARRSAPERSPAAPSVRALPSTARVAAGRALSTRDRGILVTGATVSAEEVGGPQRLEELVRAGVLEFAP